MLAGWLDRLAMGLVAPALAVYTSNVEDGLQEVP